MSQTQNNAATCESCGKSVLDVNTFGFSVFLSDTGYVVIKGFDENEIVLHPREAEHLGDILADFSVSRLMDKAEMVLSEGLAEEAPKFAA